jgi:hypothetical protein
VSRLTPATIAADKSPERLEKRLPRGYIGRDHRERHIRDARAINLRHSKDARVIPPPCGCDVAGASCLVTA